MAANDVPVVHAGYSKYRRPMLDAGVDILDVPAAAAHVCARAYRKYRKRRTSQSGKPVPLMPFCVPPSALSKRLKIRS